jgi:hypothetical protein
MKGTARRRGQRLARSRPRGTTRSAWLTEALSLVLARPGI